jgi:DNA-binding Lrp family transcriptional regulator
MDNFNSSNFGGNNFNEPIPLDQDLDKPIPLEDISIGGGSVSHAPLDLGGSSPVEAPKIKVPQPASKKPTEQVISGERITGVRTFFTKLHEGSINFLDEMIIKWLKENPGVTIKRTNVVIGPIQAKKTEPNIIITVWY